MDPATIALAIAGTKKLIETASDLKSAYKGIDNLLAHEEAAENAEGHLPSKKPKTRQQQILRQRAHDDGEQDSFSEIADEVMTKKQNEIALQNLFNEIDKKYGAGTVDEIKKLRKERKEKREAQAKEIAAIKKKEREETVAFLKKWSIIFAQLVGIGGFIVLTGWYVWSIRCVEATCR
tara:strand:- start:5836 stop:6369 length:534 start_codon:yes stop_codon:yes gene_type:complete